MDELRIDHGYKVPGCSIETESERGDVHHQKLRLAAQQELLALNGGTLGHDLILSRGAVPGIWKKVMEQLTKPRHPGHASDQQDFIDAEVVQPGIAKRFLNNGLATVQEGLRPALQIRA